MKQVKNRYYSTVSLGVNFSRLLSVGVAGLVSFLSPAAFSDAGLFDQPCAHEAFAWAENDFVFYSNGTRSDGSPAIACENLRLLGRERTSMQELSLYYRVHCYTLDRAVGKTYTLRAIEQRSGACEVSSSNQTLDSDLNE